jgi:hypothetical protein
LLGETVTVTSLCRSGDVVIGGWVDGQGVTNITGDKRFAEIRFLSEEPGLQGWTATATGSEEISALAVFAVCLHLG